MDVFEGKGLMVGGLRFLTPLEANEILAARRALLVDLREDYLVAMKRFLAPDVICIRHDQVATLSATVPQDRALILADSAGVHTKDAARYLKSQGYGNVACLNGGMLAWDQAGMPVATDTGALLHGDCACVMKPTSS